MHRTFAATLLALSVVGCASMADSMASFSGLGQIEESKSNFDGATTISMSPGVLYNEGNWMGVPIKAGARWVSSQPDIVGLVLAYDSDVRTLSSTRPAYTGITALDININGTITQHQVAGPTALRNTEYNAVTKTINTSSENVVALSLAQFEQLLTAEDVRFRIHTTNGTVDAMFFVERIPGGAATARHQMKPFLERIRTARGS